MTQQERREITDTEIVSTEEQMADEKVAANAPCETCAWWSRPENKDAETFRLLLQEWDVGLARRLANENGGARGPIDPRGLWLQWGGWIRTDAYHARHVPMNEPVILVHYEKGYMLIDGWHRIRRATREGRESYPAVVLSQEDSERVRKGV